MNDQIRAALAARLEEKGMSRADLARAVGKHPNAISRALRGLPDGGRVPDLWAAMLEAADMHLEALPGPDPASVPTPARAKPGRKPAKTGEREHVGALSFRSGIPRTRTRTRPAPTLTPDENPTPGEEIDAASLFPAGETAAPDRLVFARTVPAPKNLSGTAYKVLEAVAAGGQLSRTGERWKLESGGQVQNVDPRTVARLVSEGVLIPDSDGGQA